VRAPIVARAGDIATAEALARTALSLAKEAEVPILQADTLSELAGVLRIAGRVDDARHVMSEAAGLYAAKGDVVSAARSQAWAAQSDLR
jgi:hypothetical protein